MTDEQPTDRGPGGDDGDGDDGLEPWEVFRQEKEGDPMRHGGSVMAPDRVLAVHYARELYGRRQESIRLWVVRRTDIAVLDDPDLLQPPLDRSFKKPGGYVMRDKLAAARDQAGTNRPARERPPGSPAPAPVTQSTAAQPGDPSTAPFAAGPFAAGEGSR